jgi:hypothetical protein
MRIGQRSIAAALFLLAVAAQTACALRWLPAELDLEQDPGTSQVYRLTVQNNSDATEQVSISVQDWLRDNDGLNDFGIPVNGARWVFPGGIAAGETRIVRYSVAVGEGEVLSVQGTAQTASPQSTVAISGPSQVSFGDSGDVQAADSSDSSDSVSVVRSVSSDEGSGAAVVTLTVTALADVEGLVLYEVYDAATTLDSVQEGGSTFATVNRSCAAWVTLSADRVELAPNESQDILVTLATPSTYDGTWWCILMAQLVPRVIEQEGTRILALPQVGAKLLVTAPGTQVLSGAVTDVRDVGTDPLALEATFVNTGNVQLVVTGQVQVVDRTGDVVRQYAFEESGRDYFRILPGSMRVAVLSDSSGAEPLPAGVYQALVTFDFGGDNPVGGVRAFQIR